MNVACVKVDHFNGPIHCDIKDFEVSVGNVFVIQTEFGQDIGKILRIPYECKNMKRFKNRKLAELERLANQDDFQKMEKLEKKNDQALKVAKEKVSKHKLDMKIFGARFMFDEKRLMFYFSADNRIDFRDFVKDLASVFKIRIELRQVSQREEARMTGGLGICGQEQCCVKFLYNLDAVSIKMAKDQNLSLNAVKISGNCGKLLCCLSYEHETYRELRKGFPKDGSTVKIDVSKIDKDKYIGYSIPAAGEMTCTVKGGNILKRTVFLEISDGHVIEAAVNDVKKAGVFSSKKSDG